MPLTSHGRVDVLRRAVVTQARSFVEYVTECAVPVDLDAHPETRSALEDIVSAQRAATEQLVEEIAALDAHADLTVAFDPRFTFYNYLTTRYTLQVLVSELTAGNRVIADLLVEAADDEVCTPVLQAIFDQGEDHAARVAALLNEPSPTSPDSV